MGYAEPVCISIILSDLVIREQGTGKLSLIGTFTHFNAEEFPFAAPPFCITALVTNVPANAFPLQVEVRVEDPSVPEVEADAGPPAVDDSADEADVPQRILIAAGGQVGLHPDAPHQPDDIVELPIQLAGCAFPHAGAFRVTVRVNDEEIGFRVIKVRRPDPD